jgi:hypothetical protein
VQYLVEEAGVRQFLAIGTGDRLRPAGQSRHFGQPAEAAA